MKLIANKRSKQFHKDSCPFASNISSKNIRTFSSIQEAVLSNYRGCYYCECEYDEKNFNLKKYLEDYKKQMEEYNKEHHLYSNIPSPTLSNSGQSSKKEKIFPSVRFNLADSIRLNGYVVNFYEGIDGIKEMGVDIVDCKIDEQGLCMSSNSNVLMPTTKQENNACFHFDITFKICSSSSDNILFVKGTNDYPFKVMLCKKTLGWMPVLTVYQNEVQETLEVDNSLIKEGEVYCLSVIYDGDCVVLSCTTCGSNSQPMYKAIGRMILDDAALYGSDFDKNICIGNSQFDGYVYSVCFDEELSEDLEKIIDEACLAGMGEIEYYYRKHGKSLGTQTSQITKVESKDGDAGLGQSFTNANVYWTFDEGCHEVKGEILKKYQQDKEVKGTLGFPVLDQLKGLKSNVFFQNFQNGVIISSEYGTFILDTIVFNKYMELNAESGPLGLPVSDSKRIRNGYYHIFRKNNDDDGRIYVYDDKNVVSIYGEWFATYKKYESDLGAPLTDVHKKDFYEVYYAGLCKPVSFDCVDFENGIICKNSQNVYCALFGDIYKKYIDYNKDQTNIFGTPRSSCTKYNYNKSYCEFSNGVIVKNGGDCIPLTQIRLYLDKAVSYKIDDGNSFWYNYDTKAELVVYLTVAQNGIPFTQNGVTYNSYRLNGHSNTSYEIKKEFVIPVRRCTDVISFTLSYDDWDKTNKNDYLGKIEKTYGIDNLWGLSENGACHIYDDVPMTERGGSSVKYLQENSVKTFYSIQNYTDGPFVIDKSKFLEQCWWRFHNFDRNYITDSGEEKYEPYSYGEFVEVFSDMSGAPSGNWAWAVDCVKHPSDHIFYAANKNGAKNGICFGMSLLAIRCIKGDSRYVLPLNQYRANDKDDQEPNWKTFTNQGLRNEISKNYLYQKGKSAFNQMLDQVMLNLSYNPKAFFESIEKCMMKEEYVLLGLHNNFDGGHAVLAYGVERYSSSEWRIYFADPNLEIRDNDKHDDKISYVNINPKKNTFKVFSPVHNYSEYKNDNGFNSTVNWVSIWFTINQTELYYIPYSKLRNRPTTVNYVKEALKYFAHLLMPSADPYKFALFFCFSDNVDVEIDGESRLLPTLGGKGNGGVYLVKDYSKLSLKAKARKDSKFLGSIATIHDSFDVEFSTKKGDEDVISLDGSTMIKPRLNFKTSNERKEIKVSYIKKARNNSRLVTQMCTFHVSNDCESFVRLDRRKDHVKIYQGKNLNAIKVESTVNVKDEIVKSNVVYEPKVKEEQITISNSCSLDSNRNLVIDAKNKLTGIIRRNKIF